MKNESIDELRELYRESYGNEIPADEAKLLAEIITRLFKLVYKPIKKEE